MAAAWFFIFAISTIPSFFITFSSAESDHTPVKPEHDASSLVIRDIRKCQPHSSIAEHPSFEPQSNPDAQISSALPCNTVVTIPQEPHQETFITSTSQDPEINGQRSHIPHHVINTISIAVAETPGDQIIINDVGKTFLGLAFQAVLGLMIFHFSSSPQSTSSTPGPSSSNTPISFDVVVVSMAIGVLATLIGMLLRNACPAAASISQYTGLLSAVFGFLQMTKILLSESFSWIVWPAGVFLLLAVIFVISKLGK